MPIVLKFFGGVMDGRSANSESENRNEATWAIARYALSRQGTIGSRFEAIVGASSQTRKPAVSERGDQTDHVYEVVERTADDGDIVVRFRFVGEGESESPNAIDLRRAKPAPCSFDKGSAVTTPPSLAMTTHTSS
jgi:plasmid replication initiation protein